MSFGAMAAWQAALLVVAAAAAAAWIFRLKVRPPRVGVPSLLLWRRVLDQARELTWWERVRRAVSLVVTMLIAAALALAVTRPGPRLGAASQGRLLIVLDSSWSMHARTSSGETRWDRAIRAARALAASAGGHDVALATTADGLVEGPTSDLALIESAIDRLVPAGGEDAPWPQVAGTEAVHFITDGALVRSPADGVTLHSVYDPAPNVAITAFGVRPAPAGAAAGEAYLEVVNYADTPQDVRIVVTRGAGAVFDEVVAFQPGEAGRQVLPLGPDGGARLMARVSAVHNALDTDDEAAAWLDGAELLNVTVVTAERGTGVDLLLERAPGLRPTFVAPAAYTPGREDVVIFDRVVPREAPQRPALFIAPGDASWLGARGAEEKTPRWTASTPHPITAGVDPLTLDLQRAVAYEGAGLTPVARSEAGTPLVLVADGDDRRAVVLTFALTDSNLAFSPVFPVLFGNALEWLARPSYGATRRPGPMFLPASTSRITAPDGSAIPIARSGDRAVAVFTAPGLYLVEAGGSRGVVTVQVGDPDVSNLTRTTLPDDGAALAAVPSGARRPWWIYIVAVAFVLATLEWWTWQRRVTV
jgi:hypothetical protein